MTAQLTLAVSAAASSADLTALGTQDWLVYNGGTSPIKKSATNVLALAHIGTFTDTPFTGAPRTLSWSDGAGTISGSSTAGVYGPSLAAGSGYSITVPADTTARTLRIFTGTYRGTLGVSVSISDGSSPTQTNNTTVDGTTGPGAFADVQIDYAAASAGQTVTVSLTMVSPQSGGNIGFEGAALTGATGGGTGTPPAPTGVTVAYNDPAVLFSPYAWDDRGTYKSANAPGAYIKLAFTGTSVTAKFDVSALAGASTPTSSYPIVRMVVDGRVATEVQLTATNGNAGVFGLTSGPHTLECYFRAVDVNLADRWTTPVSALRFTGFTLDSGAAYSALAARAKNLIFFGDSITEGYVVMSNNNPAGNSSQQTVAPFLAQSLGCEYGQIGYSAQGYEQAGAGGVPALSAAIPYYSAGRSRLVSGKFSPEPDYVCVMHGANGTPTSAGVQSSIDALRTAAPNAKIFVMVQAGGYARGAIAAGAAARSSDAKLYLIDLGAGYQPGMDSSGTGGQYSFDNGLHPNLLGNAKAASGYVAKIQAAIDGAAQPTLTARTFAVSLDSALNTPAANLTGLKIRCYNPDGSLAYSTDTGTSNASGTVSVVAQSTASAGASCLMTVRNADHHYSQFVTVT